MLLLLWEGNTWWHHLH